MKKIHNITPYKGGVVGMTDEGEIVHAVIGKKYKIIAEDNEYHTAKYIGGTDFKIKKTIMDHLYYIVRFFKMLF